MYLGEVMELAPVDSIWAEQAHPYTRSLFSAVLSMDPDNRTREPPLAGDPPNPINPPSGCRFHTRCRFASAICKERAPALTGLARNRDHLVACHLHAGEGGGHERERRKAGGYPQPECQVSRRAHRPCDQRCQPEPESRRDSGAAGRKRFGQIRDPQDPAAPFAAQALGGRRSEGRFM